jgi:A/G-specific adenine glycosylase
MDARGLEPGFAQRIVAWQLRAGRHDLPWQHTRDPYRIWLSEIMLQQTQAATVIPYYLRFLESFPSLADLAAAEEDAVMHAWAGLGYYARARNLQRCARTLMREHQGQFPRTPDALAQLPGIGPSTAAAIAAFAFGVRRPILDGNVKRVLARYFGVSGDPATRAIEQELWPHEHAVRDAAPPTQEIYVKTQGQMDLGAQVCTRRNPDCARCPLQVDCYARLHACQDALPTPRARRALPERNCLMLILECERHLLMDKQASPGIWGGLWSLPRFGTLDELTRTCAKIGVLEHAGDAPAPELLSLANIAHTFTHFRLHIEPWWLRSRATALPPPPAPTQAWIPVRSLAHTAMPAPLSKLLGGLYEEELPAERKAPG